MIQSTCSLVFALPKQYKRYKTNELLFWNNMETKNCTRCHRNLPITEFYLKKRPNGQISIYSECKPCRKVISDNYKTNHRDSYLNHKRTFYQENKEHIAKDNKERYYKDIEKTRLIKWKSANKNREQIKTRKREVSKDFREKFLEMYGNKCACCGETVYEFLTLEHKKGQVGIFYKQKESGIKSYRKAIKEYRPDLYEVLCMNCNFSKGRYGYCPHQ